MCIYINKNDITYFCITEGIKKEVAFSYLDDLESKFLKEFRYLLENLNFVFEDDNKKKLEYIIKDTIEFYKKNPSYNKFDKILDDFNKSIDIIIDNES